MSSTFGTFGSTPERNTIIRELRHQLRYANQGSERDAIQAQINFWQRYRPTQEP